MKKEIILLFSFFVIGCSLNDTFKNVGDIPFDKSIDDENFNICNESNIKQYYVRYSQDSPPGFEGEKRGLENVILNKYKAINSEKENGYITIRFIVNCKGATGRFRIEEMDYDYQPFEFNNNITEQLFDIVKNLEGWLPRKKKDRSYDYYQYLTFKIKHGQIIKILP